MKIERFANLQKYTVVGKGGRSAARRGHGDGVRSGDPGLGSNGTFLDGRGVGQGAEPVRGAATISLGDTVPLASDPTGPPNRAAQLTSSPIRGRHVATCSPGIIRLEARATSRRSAADRRTRTTGMDTLRGRRRLKV